jgi:hypothetical protein
MVADVEPAADRADRILVAARELGDVRDAGEEGGEAAGLVGALERVAVEVGSVVTSTELLEPSRAAYGWLKSTRGVASLMAPLGLVARHAPRAAGADVSTCLTSRSSRTSRRDPSPEARDRASLDSVDNR